MSTRTLPPDSAQDRAQAAQPSARKRRVRRSVLANNGESWIWLTGGALALGLAMVIGLLSLVVSRGAATFWPRDVATVEMLDGRRLMGEFIRVDSYTPGPEELAQLDAARRLEVERALESQAGQSSRRLMRMVDLSATTEEANEWIKDFELQPSGDGGAIARLDDAAELSEWNVVVERYDDGRIYGELRGLAIDGEDSNSELPLAWTEFRRRHRDAMQLRKQRERLELDDIGEINDELDTQRLAVRRAELRHGEDSSEANAARARAAEAEQESSARIAEIQTRSQELRTRGESVRIDIELSDGRRELIPLWDVVRAYTPNRIGLFGKLGVYFDRWREFLLEDPRKGIQEGGVFPAIFGTVVMTLLMSIAVVPFGVLAALYLREYARQGAVTSAVRISVNNLAGVPSIVFGVFGLGFFCYGIGAWIDRSFYAERLPNPTFGTGGLMWAALTLALLTLPVVIVATEEALAAVPSSMREGSYACGATKWQTIQRIVLPRAMPGILTGMILAVARGAGEVAPLMLVGAVALAPDLPFEWSFPEFGANRSFMHLGYQIYEQGFKSPDAEASIPFVFTTTLLLIGIVVALNVVAIQVRARLRRRYSIG